MLAAPKAQFNSFFNPNLLGSGYQVTFLQAKPFSSGQKDPRSQGWDHFIHPTSLSYSN